MGAHVGVAAGSTVGAVVEGASGGAAVGASAGDPVVDSACVEGVSLGDSASVELGTTIGARRAPAAGPERMCPSTNMVLKHRVS